MDYSEDGGARRKVVVQLKFNWSHGHSTTKLVHVHGGGIGAHLGSIHVYVYSAH